MLDIFAEHFLFMSDREKLRHWTFKFKLFD